MEQSVVTTKGQIVIPSHIRNRYKIKQGTRICFIEHGADILLRPVTDEYIDSLKGSLGAEGKILETLVHEKKRETKS